MINPSVVQQFRNIASLVGNTPLLEIRYTYQNEPRRLFAKAEWYNPSGNIKDRIAFYILEKAYLQNTIQPGDTIVEATSGNTGIAFAALGAYLGHPVMIYMPDWMSRERINLMKSYGAQVCLVSRQEGGFLGSIAKTEELAKGGRVFLPRQFSNPENVSAHYFTTGKEIAAQLEALGLKADGVVAGVGTGGTIMGLGRRLREVQPACRVYPLEPLNSPTLSTGYKVGKHRIQGISDEFVPEILHLNDLDPVVSVDDVDSIIMSQKLSRQLGLGVGISSGANFLGCVMAQNRLPKDSVVVTTFADDNKKYLSTDYCDDFDEQESHLSKDIALLDVVAHL